MKRSIYKENRNPKVVYREKAYWNVLSLMGSDFAKSKEFACWGIVEYTSDDTIIVESFHLCPNTKNSAAYCEVDEDKFDQWAQSGKYFPITKAGKLRVHAHSHVNMGVTPSGTDNTQYHEKATSISDYFIQLIFNHKEEHTLNLCDAKTGIKYEGVPEYIQIQNYIYDRQLKKFFEWNEEAKEIGKEPVIPDGNVVIKDNAIQINDILSFDFAEKTFVVDGELLKIIPGQGSIYYISDDEVKEINNLFDKMIDKTSAYVQPKSTQPVSTYNNYKYSGYQYNSDYNSDYYYYNNYPASDLDKQSNIDEDSDQIIIDYYKKCKRK